jgi:hypothetical protein
MNRPLDGDHPSSGDVSSSNANSPSATSNVVPTDDDFHNLKSPTVTIEAGDRSLEPIYRCRICWETSMNANQEFLSPCLCKGTMQYVHISCWEACQCYCNTCFYPPKSIESSQLKRALERGVIVIRKPNAMSCGFLVMFTSHIKPFVTFLTSTSKFLERRIYGTAQAWLIGYGVLLGVTSIWAIHKTNERNKVH